METYDLGKLFVHAISSMSRIRSRGHIVSSIDSRGKPKPRGIFHSQVLAEMVGQESLPRKNAHRERSLGEKGSHDTFPEVKEGDDTGHNLL